MEKYLKKIIIELAQGYSRRNGFNCLGRETYDGPVFLFDSVKDQFHPASWDNIHSNAHSKWNERLEKKHPHFQDGKVREMQSCNSSDALLMNIFAHPSILKWKGVRGLLGLAENEEIEFGYEPGVHKENGVSDRTEIDIHFRTSRLICEAKLTEADFKKCGIDSLRRYEDLEEVFCLDRLQISEAGEVAGYQLIRNMLALHQLVNDQPDYRFMLFCDGRRGDLVRDFYSVRDAIHDKHSSLRQATGIVFWQEIANKCGDDLKQFLQDRYGF